MDPPVPSCSILFPLHLIFPPLPLHLEMVQEISNQ